jgi:hypothetical protein
MRLERRTGWRVSGRQSGPVAAHPRRRSLVDQAERVQPRHPVLDAGVPYHQHTEQPQEHGSERKEEAGRSARQRPDQAGGAREEGQESQPRDERGAPGLGDPLDAVATFRLLVPAGRLVRQRSLAHAACSAAAGFRAEMFSLQ